jgi:hypothetical protein
MNADQRDEVCEHARKLAQDAPPLTAAQALLVVSVFARYPLPDDDSGAVA